MKQLSETQLQENWDKLIQVIKDTFEDGSERREKLLKMYHDLEDRMIVAPASGKEEYHYCYAGGYVNHVLHVCETALKIQETYEAVGGHKDWTDEELIFSAMHHDLGKVGDLIGEYYVPQDNDWRRKTLGEVFTHNTDIQNMRVTDRALFLLQHFGVVVNLKETLAIKLSDGLYDEANPYYLKVFDAKRSLKNHLPYIIHWADHMATQAEFDEWKRGDEDLKEEMESKLENIKNISVGTTETKPKQEHTDEVLENKHKDLFDELFGDKS
jgi:hypothetical protein